MDDNERHRAAEAERWWQLYRESLAYSKEYGASTVRSLITVNGGAIIATLSFVAAGIETGMLGQASVSNSLYGALTCFGLGLVLAVVTGGLGYINFAAHTQSVPGPAGLTKYVKTGDISGWNVQRRMIGWTAKIAVALVAASVLLFLGGAYFALQTLMTISQ